MIAQRVIREGLIHLLCQWLCLYDLLCLFGVSLGTISETAHSTRAVEAGCRMGRGTARRCGGGWWLAPVFLNDLGRFLRFRLGRGRLDEDVPKRVVHFLS